MIKTAHRMDRFSSQFFAAISDKIAALQAAGEDVIRLDIGSPDLPPPEPVIQALARSAGETGHHGYQPHSATPAYRVAWVEMYRRLYRVDLDPEREVVPLIGSKEGIFNMITAHIDPGDAVLIPDPGYMTYTRGTLFAGGEPVYLPLLPERSFLPDFGAVPRDAARRAKLLWLNYPNNPTAATATAEFFAEAVDFAREYGLLICHDAAYTQVTFDGYRAPSILEAPGAKDVAVEFNTLSKSHNMAGWRVGAAVGNARALRGLYALKTNLDSGHFLPILEAAVTAMTGDQNWIPGRNEVYRRRRDCILPALRALGLQAAVPLGSLYVWSSIPAGKTSVEFATEVLEKARVSLTPGTVFGSCGEGYVRISLTAPIERVEEAVKRLEGLLENRN